jgi:hypothetical protein
MKYVEDLWREKLGSRRTREAGLQKILYEVSRLMLPETMDEDDKRFVRQLLSDPRWQDFGSHKLQISHAWAAIGLAQLAPLFPPYLLVGADTAFGRRLHYLLFSETLDRLKDAGLVDDAYKHADRMVRELWPEQSESSRRFYVARLVDLGQGNLGHLSKVLAQKGIEGAALHLGLLRQCAIETGVPLLGDEGGADVLDGNGNPWTAFFRGT